MDIKNELELLDSSITQNPDDAGLLSRRGKLYYASSQFGKALNDFMRVRELDPDSVEAQEFITMINGILEFRYTDIYNP